MGAVLSTGSASWPTSAFTINYFGNYTGRLIAIGVRVSVSLRYGRGLSTRDSLGAGHNNSYSFADTAQTPLQYMNTAALHL